MDRCRDMEYAKVTHPRLGIRGGQDSVSHVPQHRSPVLHVMRTCKAQCRTKHQKAILVLFHRHERAQGKMSEGQDSGSAAICAKDGKMRHGALGPLRTSHLKRFLQDSRYAVRTIGALAKNRRAHAHPARRAQNQDENGLGWP